MMWNGYDITFQHKFFIMVELTGEGRACIPVGLTQTWDGLINCVWKVEEGRKRPWLDLGSLEPAAIRFMLETVIVGCMFRYVSL